jgi:hypothetical protein
MLVRDSSERTKLKLKNYEQGDPLEYIKGSRHNLIRKAELNQLSRMAEVWSPRCISFVFHVRHLIVVMTSRSLLRCNFPRKVPIEAIGPVFEI